MTSSNGQGPDGPWRPDKRKGVSRSHPHVVPRESQLKKLKPYTSPAVYAAGLELHYYRGYLVIGHDGMISRLWADSSSSQTSSSALLSWEIWRGRDLLLKVREVECPYLNRCRTGQGQSKDDQKETKRHRGRIYLRRVLKVIPIHRRRRSLLIPTLGSTDTRILHICRWG